jgi:hypothetical protein
MRRLRDQGIYETPRHARQVFAVNAGGGSYLLYDREFGTKIPPRFETLPDGRVRDWHGRLTDWTVEDLIDTGETRGH